MGVTAMAALVILYAVYLEYNAQQELERRAQARSRMGRPRGM